MARFPAPSATTENLSSNVFSSLVARAQARAARGEGHVHPLHVGDTYLDPVLAARAETQRLADHPRLHTYAPVHGLPALIDAVRQRIGARAGREVGPETVQIVAGATSGLSVICQTLMDPGDEVLVLAPFWPLVRGIISSRGAKPVEVPFFDRAGDSNFDPEKALEAAITPRTVALYVNSPNNPTGHILSVAEMDAIAKVARKHNLWVLADEAYEELWYTEAPPTPLWNHEGLRDRVIAVHTMSKSYGMAGARVGYVHGPKDILAAIRSVHTFQSYCAAQPMQWAAAKALRDGDPWLTEARTQYKAARDAAAVALDVPAPMGGTFLFVNVAPYLAPGEDVVGFLERCVDAGVLLTPGASSGRDYGTWVRLCFTSVTKTDLDDALARLKSVMGKP